MRHFRLKRTITHATVLSALIPTTAALSNQIQVPIGLSGQVTISAVSSAIIAHQVLPTGGATLNPNAAPARGGYAFDGIKPVARTGVTRECVKHGFWSPEVATPDCEPWLFGLPTPAAGTASAAAPAAAAASAGAGAAGAAGAGAAAAAAVGTLDPAKAPARGGYVYDNFGTVARTGVTRECVKHGFWSPQVATPDCHPALFAKPAPAAAPAPKAAEPAPAPAPAAKKEEGFPEWIGPDEFRIGIVPVWPENEFTPPDNIGEPRMFYDENGSAHDEHAQDLISEPIMHGEHGDQDGHGDDLISPPVVYYTDDAAGAAGDDLISAPRYFNEQEATSVTPFGEGWPSDPYAAGIPEEAPAADESNDNWMPAAPAGGETVATPAPGIMEFKEEGVWPSNPYPGEFVEDQSVAASDDSWVIPSPAPGAAAVAGIGPFEENGKDPEELISNPVMYFDTEDQGVIPPELITGHTLVQTDDTGDQGTTAPELITGHTLIQGDDGSDQPAAKDDLISAPREVNEPEVAAAAPAPAAIADVPSEPVVEEEENDLLPYASDLNNFAAAEGVKPAAPMPSATPPAPPAPAAEEHLLTVVLSADALFEFDRYAVRKGGNKGLRDFVDALKEIQWGQIVVVGHTDRLGSDKYNLRLSERRAQTVRKELIKLGLDGKKIKAIGKGKSEPITKDCVGDKRSKPLIDCLQPDRRVEIFVDEKQQITIQKAPGKK